MSAITAACPASVGAVRQGETGAKNEPMNSSAAAMPVCTLLCYLCPSLSCDKRNLHGKLNNFLVNSQFLSPLFHWGAPYSEGIQLCSFLFSGACLNPWFTEELQVTKSSCMPKLMHWADNLHESSLIYKSRNVV